MNLRLIRMRLWAVLIALAATLSCSDGTLTSPTSSADLEGTWRLNQMTTSAGVHNEDLNAGRFSITLSARPSRCAPTATPAADRRASRAPPSPWVRWRARFAACASAPIDTRFTGLLTGALTVRLNNRLLQLNNPQGSELRFQK